MRDREHEPGEIWGDREREKERERERWMFAWSDRIGSDVAVDMDRCLCGGKVWLNSKLIGVACRYRVRCLTIDESLFAHLKACSRVLLKIREKAVNEIILYLRGYLRGATGLHCVEATV